MNLASNYLLQFLIGGGVIVAMSYLAKEFHPKYAAIIYAIPVQFFMAAIFIYIGTSKETIQELSIYSIYSLFALIIIISIFYLLSLKTNFWISLTTCLILFVMAAFLIIKYIK